MIQWNLDTHSGIPLYVQLKQKIIQRIIQGEWQPGHQLPTVRQMALDVSINVNTVARVYNEVERDGYIRTYQGKGTFVEPSVIWRSQAKDRAAFVQSFTQQVAAMAKVQGVSLEELVTALRNLDEA